ncbi:hypothetical protein [Labilibacter marinus]|uniref:hypothetical protein n=1 Tax=Labilibacter marinus TaxID=1477105 RepID=UPI000835F1F4|nr:hypothetical protein [Labilibacter marinus]
MSEFKVTGGARIGRANATAPFASLIVNKDSLELNASIIGNLIFQASDITSIEAYSVIPMLGQGLKINHKVESYNEKVIFWSSTSPAVLMQHIKATGFSSNTDCINEELCKSILLKQKGGSFPLKKWVAKWAIIIWNVLLLSDIIPFIIHREGFPIGKGAIVALGLFFTTALLGLVSSGFRQILLKEGRELKDIDRFLYFLLFISGFMFVSFSIVFSTIG